MIAHVFMYLIIGLVLAAGNDIFILPDYVERNPEEKVLYTSLYMRTILAIVLIVGWLPYFISLVYIYIRDMLKEE